MHCDFFFLKVLTVWEMGVGGGGVEESAQLKPLTILIIHPFSHLFSRC